MVCHCFLRQRSRCRPLNSKDVKRVGIVRSASGGRWNSKRAGVSERKRWKRRSGASSQLRRTRRNGGGRCEVVGGAVVGV